MTKIQYSLLYLNRIQKTTMYMNLCNQCLSPLFKLWVRIPLRRAWRGVLDTTLCDKVCHWLAAGQWFFSGFNKTDITEILLKVALNTINHKPYFLVIFRFIIYKLPYMPESLNPLFKDGTGFYYMDENTPSWTLSDKSLVDQNHSLYNTLQQIYSDRVSFHCLIFVRRVCS